MPTTEVATYPLRPGSDLNDPSNYSAKATKAIFDVVAQQPGVLEHHIGMALDRAREGQPVIEAMIDWTSINAHIAWRATPLHAQVLAADAQADADALAAGLITPMDAVASAGIGRMFHVDFEPHPDVARACRAPVTEVTTLHFDGAGGGEGGDEGAFEAFTHALRTFREVVLHHLHAFDGTASQDREMGGSFVPAFASGLSHEDLEFEFDGTYLSSTPRPSDGTARRGKAVVFLVSWPSIATHHATGALPSYRAAWETLCAVATKSGLVLGKVEVHHTVFGFQREA